MVTAEELLTFDGRVRCSAPYALYMVWHYRSGVKFPAKTDEEMRKLLVDSYKTDSDEPCQQFKNESAFAVGMKAFEIALIDPESSPTLRAIRDAEDLRAMIRNRIHYFVCCNGRRDCRPDSINILREELDAVMGRVRVMGWPPGPVYVAAFKEAVERIIEEERDNLCGR